MIELVLPLISFQYWSQLDGENPLLDLPHLMAKQLIENIARYDNLQNVNLSIGQVIE